MFVSACSFAVESNNASDHAATELCPEAKLCFAVVHLVGLHLSQHCQPARWSTNNPDAKLFEGMERVILGKNCIFVFVEVNLGAVAEHRHVLLRLKKSSFRHSDSDAAPFAVIFDSILFGLRLCVKVVAGIAICKRNMRSKLNWMLNTKHPMCLWLLMCFF